MIAKKANNSQYPIEYLQDLLVRMAHHSSGIEGNTISLPETVSIILEGVLPSTRKSIREFYEIENHKQTFEYLLEMLDAKERMNIAMIKQYHALLTDRLQHDRGQFKAQQNAIVGAEFKTASPQETPTLMQQWVDNTIYRLENVENESAKLKVLADSHIQFERIHPFSDGNGRTGRIVLMYLSMQQLSAPIVINQNDRASYIEGLANQDVAGLTDIFEASVVFERERMVQFGNKI